MKGIFKFFILIFFVGLFIATIASTIAVAECYTPGVQLNVFWDSMRFSVLYGISIAFDFYHYILRIDN